MKLDKETAKIVNKSRHKAQMPLYYISVLLTIAVYILIIYITLKASKSEEAANALASFLETDPKTTSFIIKAGSYSSFIIVCWLILYIYYLNVRFIGSTSSNSIRLVDSKYSEYEKIYNDYARQLGIRDKDIPVAYVTKNDVDTSILGVKVRSEKAISIPAKVLEKASTTGDDEQLRYIVTRRLAAIALGHYEASAIIATLIAQLIPVFRKVISRVKCYSTDNLCKVVLGKDAVAKAIYDDHISLDLYGDNISQEEIIKKIRQSYNNEESLGRFIENLLADKPLPVYRLEAIISDKTGRLL